MSKFREYKYFNLSNISNEILKLWKDERLFEKSIENRANAKPFIFFEGPPSANGKPGIHHVMSRTIKDTFCRFHTLKGNKVERKAGWDTHGLPVEIAVEKELGITKVDIGKKISIEDYNLKCKESVLKYTDLWNELTEKMAYWVDMKNPYITYESKYMESVWWALSEIYKKNLLYKGFKIQPYSPKAGTGLSTHELNMPGCYKDVTDTSVVAQFEIRKDNVNILEKITNIEFNNKEVFILAWTTTPWTLPANTFLAVGEKIDYVLVQTFNKYTFKEIYVIVAKNRISAHFNPKNENILFDTYNNDSKDIPYKIIAEFKGKELEGIYYEQLFNIAKPYRDEDKAFKIACADFVTTVDGTGVVHCAPTFGQDDFQAAEKNGIPPMMIYNLDGEIIPIVDSQGKYIDNIGELLSGKYVKNEYYNSNPPEKSVDVEIAIHLKERNRAFNVEKFVHSYPHCWRTNAPVLYYPMDSWFIATSQKNERLVELNKEINWKPISTGEGRFHEWLTNLKDWNLSRSRYWGTPIPIWTSEDKTEQICISSIIELKNECKLSVENGFMDSNPFDNFDENDLSDDNYNKIDLHKNFVDKIILSKNGKKLFRENDLIDVWFESGSMPFAQLHYPFENKDLFENKNWKIADFIAEGVDQTRGWFFTLHTISTLLFDRICFKNVVSNGLVLDKTGVKMSKSLGNVIEPFEALEKYGVDSIRWYMMSNSQVWDNIKFDINGVEELQRKLFSTLYNTYNFFAMYANLDNFTYKENEVDNRAEIDNWILSKLNTLVKLVDDKMSDYEVTESTRAIYSFVYNDLSNWYVRLSRRKFWKGDYSEEKISAYQTLYTCLETIAILMSPIAPMYSDRLYRDLNEISNKSTSKSSVHLCDFPQVNYNLININLEEKMYLAQKISSMTLSLRHANKLKVRIPLQKIIIPVINSDIEKNILEVKDLILSEVNVKEMELISNKNDYFEKFAKPNFKTIGPKYGKLMKVISDKITNLSKEEISNIENNKTFVFNYQGDEIQLNDEDIDIITKDIPGMSILIEDNITVALDTNVSNELRKEGIAREFINKIQNLRKEKGFELTDRINIEFEKNTLLEDAIILNENYISNEVLAKQLIEIDEIENAEEVLWDKENNNYIRLKLYVDN